MRNKRKGYLDTKANISYSYSANKFPKETGWRVFLVGFTLVELLVTVSILTIGVISVLRSFLSVSGAFSRSNNLFNAAWYLEKKISDIEEEAIKEEGLEAGREEGEFNIEGRRFSWLMDIEELEEEQNLTRLFLEVAWREGNQERNISLITYLENKTIENETE
jgi:type II secretion system protein I